VQQRLASVTTGRHRLPRNVEPEATVVSDSPVQEPGPASSPAPPVGSRWARVVGYGVLPALTVVLGGGAGVLTWEVISAHLVEAARIESVRAAQDGAAAILTYRPDTVNSDLGAARDRLTGKFKDSYTLYTHQTVIPDARQKQISSMVYVPGSASVSATLYHAVVMVYVNQTFMHDPDPPTSTASSVRVTLEKVGRRWLISDFTPVA
jgi:Mce-associated membrane protein